jgi:hypothetical protein
VFLDLGLGLDLRCVQYIPTYLHTTYNLFWDGNHDRTIENENLNEMKNVHGYRRFPPSTTTTVPNIADKALKKKTTTKQQ